MPDERAAVVPRLSAFDTAMVVFSLVVGIGIFRTPALVAGAAGTDAGFLAAWVIGGAVSLAGALVFAEIGSRYPRPGGYYKVVAHCWHPLAAFLLNWAQLLMQGAGAAGVAVIGAEYLLRLGGRDAAPGLAATGVAAVMLAGLIVLNLAGIRSSARTQNVLSVAKIVLIAGLALAGLAFAGSAQDTGSPAAPVAGAPAGILAALVAVFYTYGGYQNTMNLAADVRDAPRNLPRAVIGGMAVVTLLYCAINVAYLRALGASGVAASPLVAADLADLVLGRAGEAFVSVAIFCSAAGFVNATTLHVPRSYVALAADGLLPPALGRVDPRTQAQRAGLGFFAATVFVPLAFLGSFERLLAYVMFTDALSLVVVASCLFVLRRRREGEGVAGVWRLPGYPWLPAAFILVLAAVAVDLLVRQTAVALAGIALIVAGLPLYLGMQRLWAE